VNELVFIDVNALCSLPLFCSSAIMDCLVVPLQEKLEDWKKTVINLDKEHAKGQ
jgi:hypothetical protein